jgi:hypothetical protein
MLDKSAAHMLSTVAAVYAILVYSIAFSLELWFIFTSDLLDHNFYSSSSSSPASSSFEANNPSTSGHSSAQQNLWTSVPVAAFAFILAAIYFITVTVSLLLMLGIIVRSMLCLLVWLVTFGLLFLPECALIMHLSLNVWVSLFKSVFSKRLHFNLLFYLNHSELIQETDRSSCVFMSFERS